MYEEQRLIGNKEHRSIGNEEQRLATNKKHRSIGRKNTETATEVLNVCTDGACKNNPGRGGWAWVIPNGHWACGAEPHTTNQRMELKAVLESLQHIQEGHVNVFSDSTYVVKCFNDRWYEGWLKRGWRTAARKPVANQDLWEPVIHMFLARQHEITWTWVKGHSHNVWNNLADQLASQASLEQRNRRGDTTSTC